MRKIVLILIVVILIIPHDAAALRPMSNAIDGSTTEDRLMVETRPTSEMQQLALLLNLIPPHASTTRAETTNYRLKHISPEEFGRLIAMLQGGTIFNQEVLTDRQITIGDTQIYSGYSPNYGGGQGVFTIESKFADAAIYQMLYNVFYKGQTARQNPPPIPHLHFSFIMHGAVDNKPHTSFTKTNGESISYEGFSLITFDFRGPLLVLVIADQCYEFLVANHFDNFLGVTGDRVGWAILSESQCIERYDMFKNWFWWIPNSRAVSNDTTQQSAQPSSDMIPGVTRHSSGLVSQSNTFQFIAAAV